MAATTQVRILVRSFPAYASQDLFLEILLPVAALHNAVEMPLSCNNRILCLEAPDVWWGWALGGAGRGNRTANRVVVSSGKK